MWKNHTSYSLWSRNTWYVIIILFVLIAQLLWKVIQSMYIYILYIYIHTDSLHTFSHTRLSSMPFLFGGNARCFIVSDQQKYIKCMLCLICIEMWFKVCLTTWISIVTRRRKKRTQALMKLTKCGLWSYLYLIKFLTEYIGALHISCLQSESESKGSTVTTG